MYSPKISPELVKKLYQLKQINKKPMTRIVNEAITQYLDRSTYGPRINMEENNPVDINNTLMVTERR